jgi:membrane carboxypeptidase/penicillin-binding protein
VLREVIDTGTGKGATALGVGRGAAGKSGTTDGNVDAWFAGVTGNYAVTVWVGFDARKTTGLTGSQAALPTWARFVDASGTDEETLEAPQGVTLAEVCVDTDLPPCGASCATREEWFPVGGVPSCEGGAPEGPDEAPRSPVRIPRDAPADAGAPAEARESARRWWEVWR